METLKGKSILIGKEPEHGRLQVSFSVNAERRTAFIGQPGSVPTCVSRCNPEKGVAHCRIDIDQSGKMRLTNIKEQNVTYVNDIEIECKAIKPDSIISMGKDRFLIDTTTILNAVRQASSTSKSQKRQTPASTKTKQDSYSINHLREVRATFETDIEKIQRKQQLMARFRMIPIMLGSLSTLIAILAGHSSEITLYITAPIAVLSFITYAILLAQKDTSIDDRKKAEDIFMDNYVCPNPNCNHFMGNTPYKILRQTKKCPWCGAIMREN